MQCPQCGSQNASTARFCATCGFDLENYRRQWQSPGQPSCAPPPYQQQQPQFYEPPPYYQQQQSYRMVPNVPSYMGWAIATLILCFWPTGIVAVVYASQVGSKLARGDYAGALHASARAKLWCWISFAIAIAWIAIVIVIAVLTAASVTIY